ncbi:tetratricopeptide repeat protein [Archangium sp.]|uniref:tetratricopeptide repeat protein n=1 Tax=Archangium sp. TaxID=1872627 RepID=UPI002D310931|nr:tetratricopeptide repeat protein [Archangium sp.]HYO56825.1 tetratricopeptide repeat protein [Archangium sp.]
MHRLLLLLALTLAAPSSAQSARALNTEGFRLYQAGKYPEALEKFEAAARADPKFALAHYNVAATLGVLRKKGEICQYSAHRQTILERLNTAIQLDPRRLARAKEDADLDPIRDTLGWQRLLGRSPAKQDDVPELLRRVTWFSPGEGVYGSTRKLTFPERQRVVLWRRLVENPSRTEEQTGTYTVKGRTITLSFPGSKPIQGRMTARGVLEFEGWGTFLDSPSECEA